MRVISGTHRRRTLLGPRGHRVTRPIPDRVKQSLFDRLWAMGALDGQAAIDIFAGTGSLGIEALSRGIGHCTFVERDRSARTLLIQNLTQLDLSRRANVLATDALAEGWTGLVDNRSARLVFCDPPYKMSADTASCQRIAALMTSLAAVTTPDAILVLRLEKHAPPPSATVWSVHGAHSYGSGRIYIYTPAVSSHCGPVRQVIGWEPKNPSTTDK